MVEKISFYDIKLHSPHKDVVVVKGSEAECDPIPIEGAVKLSINQNMHLKKVKLALIGEFSVAFFQRDERGDIKEQVVEKFITLKVDWENLLINDQGELDIGNYGDIPIKSYKLKKHNNTHHSSGARPKFERAQSVQHFEDSAQSSIKLPNSGVDGTPFKNQSSHHSFLLPKGNYSLPFRAVLPTNICETVEGLTIGKMLYRFESSIQKGMFEKPITKYRYLRIFRSLHPTSLALTDNVDINNTWPGKVDYRVYLNKKGIAVGTTIPIKVLIVPLVKGLKLKRITAEIIEHHHISYLTGKSPEFEQIYGSQQIMGKLDDSTLMKDMWDLHCHFKVPNNLKEITQSCTLNHGLIEVKHRIRVVIQIKNPDTGTVSELRAHLPIHIYVSSNIGHVYGSHIEIDQQYGLFNVIKAKDDAIFKKDRIHSSTNSNTNSISSSPAMSPNISSTNLAIGPSSAPEQAHLQTAIRNAFLPTDIFHALEQDQMAGDEDEEEDELDNLAAPPLYEAAKFDKVFDILSPKSPIEQLGIEYFDIPRKSSKEQLNSPSLDAGLLNRIPSYNEAVDDDEELGKNDPAPGYDNYPNYSSSGGSSINLNKSHSIGSLQAALDNGNQSNSSFTPSLSSSVEQRMPHHSRTKSHPFKLHLPKGKKK